MQWLDEIKSAPAAKNYLAACVKAAREAQAPASKKKQAVDNEGEGDDEGEGEDEGAGEGQGEVEDDQEQSVANTSNTTGQLSSQMQGAAQA